MRTIIDAIPSQVWSQRPDGTVNYLNRRWYEYTGLSPKETYGAGGNGESLRPLTATYGAQAIVHPDDVPSARAKWLKEILPAGEPGQFEVRLRRHDGEYRWFIVRVEPVRDERGNDYEVAVVSSTDFPRWCCLPRDNSSVCQGRRRSQ